MSWLSRAIGPTGANILGGLVGGGVLGGAVAGVGGLGGLFGGDMPREYFELLNELKRQMAAPEGYSPEEMEAMQGALTGAAGQQRGLALGGLREQMTRRGAMDSGAYMMGQGQIQSGYADALMRGIQQLLAESQGVKRQRWGQAAGLMGQLVGQRLQMPQQDWAGAIGQAAGGFFGAGGGG